MSSSFAALSSGGGAGAAAAPPLPRLVVSAYALGHVLNDMCAACWFSYLLLYLEARGLSPLEAGAVLFSGQLFDALATPAVGLLSDRSRGWPALGLGRRKLWNLGGALLVAVCFLGVFGTCVACWGAGGASVPSGAKTAAFAFFASAFNVGWAAVQVSHMALVPELTHDDGERVLLNSARYGMTVLSNCAVFLAMLAILRGAGAGGAPAPAAGTPGFDLAPTYQTLSFVVIGIGGVCTALFLVGTPEKVQPLLEGGAAAASLSAYQQRRKAAAAAAAADGGDDAAGAEAAGLALQSVRAKSAAAPTTLSPVATAGGGSGGGGSGAGAAGSGGDDDDADVGAIEGIRRPQMTWREWVRLRAFYQVMAVYSLTRLATNVSQVYLSFFVTASLGMDQTAIALVPLLLYLAQLSATLALKPVAARFGRRNAMTLGAALIGAACALMLTLGRGSSGGIYPAMLLLGAGSAISMVISVSLESDLIGSNTESGAFVYGACSFADKLSNGVAIIAVQFAGDGLADHSDEKGAFIRVVNGLVPMAAIAAATLVCWTISFPRHLQSRAQQLRDGAAEAAAASPGPVAAAGAGRERGRGSLAEPLIAAVVGDSSERRSLLAADSLL